MKKISIGLLCLIIVVLGVFGYNYYQKIYVGHTAYAKVSNTEPERTLTKDSSGKVIENSYSYEYEFTFIKEDGSTEKIGYEIAGENPEPLQANSYIEAEISQTRIVEGPKKITEQEVPKTVLAKLDQ